MLIKSLQAAAGNVAPTDPNFEYVTMLLHGDGTNGAQNNTFTDSSTNNFTITRNGNTTQGTFSPYGSNWSNYFDGTVNGYQRYADSGSVLDLSDDFTVEFWVFQPALATRNGTINVFFSVDTLSRFQFYQESGGVTVDINGSGIISTSSKASLNTWAHYAVVRSGSTVTLYLDGTSIGSGTSSYSIACTDMTIGGQDRRASGQSDAYHGCNAYISNFRVVKGTAVYTGSFTPSTTPLTAISGTSLLACQSNRFRDNSSNTLTPTTGTGVSVQRFSPFAPTAAYSTATIGGSGYFDGTGDSLSTPVVTANNVGSADDYCVEAWIYLTNQGGVTTIYSGDSVGYLAWRSATQRFEFVSSSLELRLSYTYPVSRWCHVAVTRQSGTVRMFVDGVLQSPTVAAGSATGNTDTLVGASTTYYFGSYTNATSGPFYGYISGFRLVKGSAVYNASFAVPTSPPTAIANTAILLNFTNAGIIDNAMMNDLETVGNAQISTSVKKYGTGSLAFDGTGDYLTAPYSPWMRLINGDFTIEFWMYLGAAQANMGIVSSYENNNGWFVRLDTTFIRLWGGDGSISVDRTYSFSTSVWYHVAITRSGNTVRMFVDGSKVGSDATVGTATDTGALGMQIGRTQTITNDFNGYIDDLRITKGYARYTSSFTPPTSAFPNT
jgi:hypothetical protein